MAPSDKPPGSWSGAYREAMPYLGFGITLAVVVSAGLGAGYFVDNRAGTTPLFFILGGVAGIVAAGLYFFKVLMARKP
jgi:F0F1-type ATP synthase assembly protein I